MKRILQLFVLMLVALMSPITAQAQSIPGDVNGNGEVNIADVNAVIDVLLGYDSNPAADVNCDGEINIADVNAIIDIILGMDEVPDHEWVDLGLPSRTMWATCNIGAESPEDYGDYFAWGETEAKDNYTWDTYKWCNGTNKTLTKYCTESAYGIVDSKSELDAEDDAAFVNWGPAWRMPTLNQFNELEEWCNWQWTQKNGVNGYLVNGRNGNTIFLPAAGSCNGSSNNSVGSFGYYWSRELSSNSGAAYAGGAGFSSGWTGGSGTQRCNGWTVRAVRASLDYIYIEQKSLDLGGVPIGETRTAELSIVNCTDEAMLMTATIDEPFSFQLEDGSASSITIEVPDNTRTPVNVMLAATVPGDFNGNVTIHCPAFNGGQKVIPVHALAFSADFMQREWVDLGLPSGTLWATRDIGASNPLEKGDSFVWGRTTPSRGTDMLCNGSENTNLEYAQNSPAYLSDNTAELGPQSDAAYVNWGPAWRMPSSSQIYELINSCTCYRVLINGVFGRLVIGPNGNSLFMPASGYYWSRTPANVTDYAYGLVLDLQDLSWNIFWGPRSYSHNVRAVRVTPNNFYVEQESIDFGGVPVGETRTSKLTIANCTNWPMELKASADEPFLLKEGDSGVASTTIEVPENSIVTVMVMFMATTPGQFNGNVTIQSLAFSEEQIVVPVHARAYTDEFPEYDYVDLGLPSGTLWATMNVGASTPEDYGDYFAWGETEPKENYSWGTYKWCNGTANSLTKYNSISSYGTVDNKTELELEDDAAYVNWGPKWRMPSQDQITELLNCCTWQWTTENGVNGQLVTGPNGNTLFMPASGYRLNQSPVNGIGVTGRYWSSTLSSGPPRSAYYLHFGDDDWHMAENVRSGGLNVRAVRVSPDVTPKLYIEEQSLDLGEVPIGGTGTGELTIVNNTSKSETVTATVDGPFTLKQENGRAATITVVVPSYSRATVTVVFTATTVGEFNNYVIFRNSAFNGGVCFIPVQARAISNDNWVDLGLPSGTLWATMNVGASCPEEYGDYFAWGETEPKEVYMWENYKWCNGSGESLTKYCTDSDYGAVDGKTFLDPQDDAAFVNWGPEWRIPSMEQIYELRRNCSSVRTQMNGVDGRLITGPNGNTIFLPGAGHSPSSSGGYSGDYWSRNSSNRFAEGLWTDAGYNSWGTFSDFRYKGHVVRAVRAPAADFYIEQQSLDLGVVPLGTPHTGDLTIVNNTVENMTFTATVEEPFTFKQGESSVSTMTIVVPGQSCVPLTVMFDGEIPGPFDGNVTIKSSAPDGVECIVPVHVLAFVDVHVDAQKEFVDLGLPSGTLWATMNVGANSPEECGDYFAWGETAPKEVYSWETYKWCNGNGESLTKYCTNSDYGTVDNKAELEPEDDAACVNWGPAWRMPTKAQQEELERECVWRRTVANGMYGYLVIGPNGKSLFLPSTGEYVEDLLDDVGVFGYYWSRAISSYDEPDGASGMGFNPQWIGGSGISRCYGWTVRAVRVSVDRVFVEQQSLDVVGVPIGETSTGDLTIANSTDEPQTFTVTTDAPFSFKQGDGSVQSLTVVVPGMSCTPVTVSFTAATPGLFDGNVIIQNPLLDGGQCVVPVRAVAYIDDLMQQEYVDLGLPSGTLWATRDIGASNPEECGYNFQWGKTTPLRSADNSDNDSEIIINECPTNNRSYLFDNTTELGPGSDAAYVNWGPEWRMPSLEQMRELIDSCICFKALRNDVMGRLVIGPNGNTIFFPIEGYYWSRTRPNTSFAGGMHFDSSSFTWGIFWASDFMGCRVRPVRNTQE